MAGGKLLGRNAGCSCSNMAALVQQFETYFLAGRVHRTHQEMGALQVHGMRVDRTLSSPGARQSCPGRKCRRAAEVAGPPLLLQLLLWLP